MPVFIGFTEKAQASRTVDGEKVYSDVLGRPQLVTNWTQFTETFGGFMEGAYLPQAVYGYFLNGGSRCYVVSVKTLPKAQAGLLNTEGKQQLIVQARQAGFDGLNMRVKVDVPKLPAASKSKSSKAKEGEEGEAAAADSDLPPFTVTVEKQKATGGWQVKETLRNVTLMEEKTEEGKKIFVAYQNNKLSEFIDILIPEGTRTPLAKLWPTQQEQPLGIESKLLAPVAASEFQGEVTARTGIEGLESLDDATMLVVPDLMTPMPDKDLDLGTVKSVQGMMVAHCEKMGDRVAILDAPPDLKPQEALNWRMNVAGYDSSYAAFYYPWIEVYNPIIDSPTLVPPSGHMAGIWARNDTTRGGSQGPR
jgi:hypothetical protein